MNQEKKNNIVVFSWVLQIICGVGLVFFALFEHIPAISSIILGNKAFKWVANEIENMPFLNFFIFALVAAIVIHGFINLRIISKIYKKPATVLDHTFSLKHSRTLIWVIQCITGSFLAFFLIVHLWVIHVSDKGVIEIAKTAFRMRNPLYMAFYFYFLVILVFHAVNGTRSALVKFGVITKKPNEGIFFWGLTIFSLLIITLGTVAIFVFAGK